VNNEKQEKQEAIEFVEQTVKEEGTKTETTRIRLDANECEINRVMPRVMTVAFTERKGEEERLIEMDIEITPVPISQKKGLIRRCSKKNPSGFKEIDWERLDDLVIAMTIGLTEEQWLRFKETHPIGLYTKIALAVKEANGESGFTSKQIEELKNLGGQEQ